MSSLYYRVVGEGLPVVLLHGWTLDHQAMFHAMEPVFQNSGGWKRIYIDLPGMGKSDPKASVNNADAMLMSILELLDTLVPDEPFVLCGYSYGGYLARGIAHFRQDLVRGMLLMAPVIVPEPSDRVLPPPRVLKRDPALMTRLSPDDADEFASMAVIQGGAEWHRFQAEILLPSRNANSEFLDRIRQGGYGFTFGVDERSAPFRHPTLIIAGRQDPVVGYRDAWNLIAQYPRATFAVLDMAGHNLQIEQTRLFEALVQNWLERLQSEFEFSTELEALRYDKDS